MGWNLIYEEFAKRKTSEGVFFVLTPANRLVELFFYAKTLVKVRARQFSSEQLDEFFKASAFSKVTFSPMPVKTESIDPEVILHYFPYVAENLLVSELTTSVDRINLIELLRYLDSRDCEKCKQAIDVMTDCMRRLYPDFSLDPKTIRERVAKAHEILGAPIPGVNIYDISDDMGRSVVSRIFERHITDDAFLKTVFMHYLFFGAALCKIYQAIVGNGGADAQASGAKVLVPAGFVLPSFRSIRIYRGGDFLLHIPAYAEPAKNESNFSMLSGEAKIASGAALGGMRNSEKKDIEVLLSPQDISVARLQIGHRVNVIFSDAAA
jgi:hypothetical protein